jgi:hypothetical protein
MTFWRPLAAALMLAATPAFAQETAGGRLAQCTHPDEAVRSQCITYILGWQVSYEVFRETCIPEGTTGERMREAFVRYVEANPRREGDRARDVIRDAMFDRWPC